MTRFIFLLIFLFSSCSTKNLKQESLLDNIRKRGVLIVGMTGDYAPFSHQNKQTGEFEGIDILLAKSLADSLGVKLEIYKTSWPTLIEDAKEGKYDVALSGISKSLKRQQIGLFSKSYFSCGKQPITRCHDIKKYSSLKKINRPQTRVIVNPD